jgi:hypothetical protein
MSSEIEFPRPMRLNNRLYFARSALEKYKRALVAEATGAEPVPYTGPEVFVPVEQAAQELGVTRRTIGRRIRGFDSENPQTEKYDAKVDAMRQARRAADVAA